MDRFKLITPWILIVLLALATLPAGVMAQRPPEFAELTVELWPEYDQPEVLVIYRASLSRDTELPATVTFRLPSRVEDVHAIAVERNGGLFNMPQENIRQERSGDELLLTISTDEPNLHLEYYDPGLLTTEGESRRLDYSFTAEHPIAAGRFQVQSPLQSQGFSMTPAPSDSFTDSNGFSYQAIEPTGLAAGDAVELSATYQRGTDAPSVQFLAPSAPAAPEHAADVQVVTSEAPSSANYSLGYILIGVGLALLLATGGYWWWSTRQAAAPAGPAQRGPQPGARRQKRAGGSKARTRSGATPTAGGDSGGYCYQCGTALRPDAQFCHICGAERRKG